ncbi:hypothetical protein [Kribbella sp. DT2]|uniref:hypothetical protein n=1 Tax=Kribbella sp. DT2 TaxID=3393427 RepID=UPI003CEF73A8
MSESELPEGGAKSVPSEAELQEMVELLDEVGLDFALHQHHPLSYLEGEAV